MRYGIRCLLLLVLLAGPAAAAKHDVIWLAVGSEELTAPLAPLAERRKADGYVVKIAKPPVADAIRALGRAPSVLLLVGDYEPGKDGESWQLPPMRRSLYKWRKPQRAEFSSDALYGDTDGDLIPDFPVGRIPARTPEQVKIVVAKTLAYEKRAWTPDDLRIVAWAGAPGYGGAIDAMATGMLVSTVRKYAPAWADRFLLSGDGNSPLCGWPPDQATTFNEQWKKGAVLAAFVAHASDRAVYSMRHEGESIRYDQASAGKGLPGPFPVAPAVFLTCYSGEFDDGNECLAESLLFLPGGPPLTIAATTESHPLTNLFTGRALLKELSKGGVRIGPLWVAAQRNAKGMRDFLMENMLKDVEGKLEDRIDVAKLRRDQALMFSILGDPALRIRLPLPQEVAVEKSGETWRFSVVKPKDATRLTVGYRALPGLKKAPAGEAPTDAAAANDRLAAANAKEGYTVVRTLTAEEDWSGELAKPGAYRFVVGGPGPIRVGAATVR